MSYHFYDMGFKDGYKKALQESRRVNEKYDTHGMKALEPDTPIYDTVKSNLDKSYLKYGAPNLQNQEIEELSDWMDGYLDLINDGWEPTEWLSPSGQLYLVWEEPVSGDIILLEIDENGNPIDGRYTFRRKSDGAHGSFYEGVYTIRFNNGIRVRIMVDGTMRMTYPNGAEFYYSPNTGGWLRYFGQNGGGYGNTFFKS